MYIGTTNPGKVAEIAAMLSPLGIELNPVSLDVPENNLTFEDNAKEKALTYAQHTGEITISEDSGLLIPALENLPGVWSARFVDLDVATRQLHPSFRDRTEIDRLNNTKVLELMKSFSHPHRAAIFKVVLTVAKPSEVLFQATGECHGWLAETAQGSNGFGYDPIFIGQNTFGKTFAELDPMRKNLRSHRKKVLDQLFDWVSQHQEQL